MRYANQNHHPDNILRIHLTLLEYSYDLPHLPFFGFGMDAPTVMNLASQVLM